MRLQSVKFFLKYYVAKLYIILHTEKQTCKEIESIDTMIVKSNFSEIVFVKFLITFVT